MSSSSVPEPIDLVVGTAVFLDDKTLSVDEKKIQAKFFVLATGAKPMELPIEGMEHVITSDEFLELSELPPSILFIGGGFISFEFAHFAARLGSANQRSVILEVTHRPLGTFDAEMVELLAAVLFTYPQFAMVGKTEEGINQEVQTYRKSFAKNLSWPTYQRVGLKDAAYKMLIDTKNQILGAHLLSDHAAGMINTIKQAMLHQTTVDELFRQTIVSPYPTRESDLSYMLKPLLTD